MSISFVHLRRALLGTSCAIVFGFGSTQALASPMRAASPSEGYCTEAVERLCQQKCLYRGANFGHCYKIGEIAHCECVYL